MRDHLSRILLLFLLTGLVMAGCKTGSGGKRGKKIPAEVLAKYREDAARLALRELNSSRQSGENEARIPSTRIDFFYELLMKAHRMSMKNKEIPNGLSGIHTLRNPNMRQMLVVLEKDAEFKNSWANGGTTTGNLYLNQLMSRYKLKPKNFREGTLGPTLILESPDFINTPQLALLFERIPGIKSAQAEGLLGDGNDITWGSDSKKDMALKCSIGREDCPSGCIYQKYWIFYVTKEGEMTYMGTRGSLPNEGGMED